MFSQSNLEKKNNFTFVSSADLAVAYGEFHEFYCVNAKNDVVAYHRLTIKAVEYTIHTD